MCICLISYIVVIFININYDSKFLLCGWLRTGVHQRLLRQNKKRSNSVDSPASQWNCALTALTMHTPTPTPNPPAQPRTPPHPPLMQPPPSLLQCCSSILSHVKRSIRHFKRIYTYIHIYIYVPLH